MKNKNNKLILITIHGQQKNNIVLIAIDLKSISNKALKMKKTRDETNIRQNYRHIKYVD